MQRMRESVDEYLYQRNFSGAVSIRLDQEQLYVRSSSDYLPVFESKEKKYMSGTKVSYSNVGYVLLGVIIEKVSGQLFRHYMGEQVFEPLNMKSTGFYAFNDLPPNTAWGYMSRGEKLVSNIYQLPIRGGEALIEHVPS